MFLQWGVVSTSPNPQARRRPLVGCPRLLIRYIRRYPPYWMKQHSVVTGTPLIAENKCIIIKIAESNGIRQFFSFLRTVPYIVPLTHNEVISCRFFDVGLNIWSTISDCCVSEKGKNNIIMFLKELGMCSFYSQRHLFYLSSRRLYT